MHPQASLRYRQETRTGRRIADDLVEPHTLALEVRLAAAQRGHVESLAVPVTSPRNHRCRHEHEPEESAGNDPAPPLQPSLRHARRRALRARGFRLTSSTAAVTAFRVTSPPFAFPPQVHLSWRGGQTQSRDHSRIACFTVLSSPEWYDMTARTPPAARRSRRTGSAVSRERSSSLTAIRTA